MSLGQIIRKQRESLHLTLDEVSGSVGYSKPYLSTIENSKVKNPPGDDLLRKLEELLGFEAGLLRHIAHIERTPADIRRNFEESEAENVRWRRIVKNIISEQSIPENIDQLLSDSELKVDGEKGSESVVKAGSFIPIINRVAAGYPVDFDDMDYPVGIADDYVRSPDLHDANAFAVRVVGDSMEPKFKEGDIVIFSPAAEVNNGDDCFVRFAMPHETTFKRVFYEQGEMIRLQPRNQNYPPMIVEASRVNGIYKAVIRYEQL